MRKQKPQLPAVRERAFELCASCIGGWVTKWTPRVGFVPLPTVVRCACFLAHQEALATVRGAVSGMKSEGE